MTKEFKSFCKTVGGNEGQKCYYPTRLDTYGCGCFHDCNYCYAKSLLSFRNLWNPLDPSVADIKNGQTISVSYYKTNNLGQRGRWFGATVHFQYIEP